MVGFNLRGDDLVELRGTYGLLRIHGVKTFDLIAAERRCFWYLIGGIADSGEKRSFELSV